MVNICYDPPTGPGINKIPMMPPPPKKRGGTPEAFYRMQ